MGKIFLILSARFIKIWPEAIKNGSYEVMTRQEALEYLNLPVNSSDQLVRKRYLELHKDYQKAINNAPSDHFRTLYRENLDKIEEAYLLMMEREQEVDLEPDISDMQLIQRIKEAQHLVNSMLEKKNGDFPGMDSESRSQIQSYIDKINLYQSQLRQQQGEEVPAGSTLEDDAPQLPQTAPFASSEVVAAPQPVLMTGEGSAPMVESQPEQTSGILEREEMPSEEQELSDFALSSNARIVPATTYTWDHDTTLPDIKEEEIPVHREAKVVEESIPKVKRFKKYRKNGKAKPGSFSMDHWLSLKMKDMDLAFSPNKRYQLYNKVILAAIMLIILIGVGGLIYIIFPILFSTS